MLTLDHSKHFFSQLARVLGTKLPGSGTAASFLATIKSWEKKGEFAREELVSSELLPWLSSRDSQAHLSKEEVVSRVQGQLPPLGFLLNGPPPGGALARESYSVEQDSTSGKCLLVDDYGVEVESFDSEADAREFARGSSTRYATHSTAGGEHYRELLITLPKNEAAGPDERGANYFSGHWTGIANVVAHVRFDERLSLEGRRVLFCQEFQSDWHQEGRRRGYCDDPPLTEEQQSRLDILLSAKEQAGGVALSPQDEQDLAALSMLREQKAAELSRNGVAGGPYKKSWPLVAFKEALLWAALYGFDALAWTKGEEHIKRYSHLRKNADTIQWIKLSENNYLVNAFEHGRDVVVRSGMTVSDLVDALGETAAAQIASSPFSDGEITGAKLRVDDKGMYGFYDHIMPKIVDKYLKRWKTKTNEIDILKDTKNHWYVVPASEFHKGRVPAGEKEWVVASANGRRDRSFHDEEDALDRADFLNDTFAAHGFYISEDMRSSLVAGQPLFSASEIEESAPTEVEITRERDSVERAYYGYSDGRSKGLRVWISPDDFLALAAPSLGGTVEARAGRMGAFDNEKFNGTDYLPHLQIERDGQVVDHEGRARALVAKRSGVAKIPVTISMYRPVADVDGFPKNLIPQKGGQPVEIKGGRLVSKLSAPASERAPRYSQENPAIPVKESPEASAIAAAITKTMVGGAAVRFEYIQFNRAFFTPFGGAWTDRESTFGVAELTEKEVLAALHDKAQAYKIEKEEYYANPDTRRRSELSEEAGVESGRTGVDGVGAADANRNRSHEDQDGQRDVREDQTQGIVGSTITDPVQMVEPVTDIEKKYLGRNRSIGHLTNRQAITELLLSGVTPSAREKLKERLHDHVLGEYGAVKFADIDETIADLHGAGIPYVYGRVDGGNLGGLNDYRGNHYDADADIKEIWGKEYVAAARKYGAVIGRDQGDEFKEVWPNYTRAEVEEIRADIEKNIRARADERGLTDVFHPKIKMPTGALYTAYGYVDAATTPEGKPAFRDMDREADFLQKEMKITYEIEQAIARGYVQLEGTKEYRQKEEGDELTELQQEMRIAEGSGEQRGPGVYNQDEHKPRDGSQGQGDTGAVEEDYGSSQVEVPSGESSHGGIITVLPPWEIDDGLFPVSAAAPASPPKFTIEPLREKSILVKGDSATIFTRLEAAGIKASGVPNATHGGLTFAKKHEVAIRKALDVNEPSVSVIQEGFSHEMEPQKRAPAGIGNKNIQRGGEIPAAITWENPTEAQLEEEWKTEDLETLFFSGYPKPDQALAYKRHWFANMSSFSKAEAVDPDDVKRELYITDSDEQLAANIEHMNKNVPAVRAMLESGKAPMPLLIRKEGKLKVLGGRTRMSLAAMAGQEVKALVIDDSKMREIFYPLRRADFLERGWSLFAFDKSEARQGVIDYIEGKTSALPTMSVDANMPREKVQLEIERLRKHLGAPEDVATEQAMVESAQVKETPQSLNSSAAELQEGKIKDFGEKIGGARKDLAEKGGARPKVAMKESGSPWRNRFKVMENGINQGEWIIADTKSKSRWGNTMSQKFSSEDEAQKAVPLFAVAAAFSAHQESDGKWEVYKKIGDRKRLKMTEKAFPSREEAMKYMALNAEVLLETKTSFGEEILPVPEIAIRNGAARRTKDATPEMFMEIFAPRAIEFGNWNNQEERQLIMNHAFDGLLDLSDVLGLPPKALMLDGDLAIAFGARGQGLVGAKAHYETGYGVINLTKMRGAGSLAHEWMHALDHYLARIDTKAKSEKVINKRGDKVYADQDKSRLFQSHGPSIGSAMRSELKEAYSNLIKGLLRKAEQYVEDSRVADEFLAKARQNLREKLDGVRNDLADDLAAKYNWRKIKKGLYPASAEQLAEFDLRAGLLVEGGDLETEYRYNKTEEEREGSAGKKMRRSALGALMSGRHSNDTLDAISAIYKAVRNRSGFAKEYSGPLDRVSAAMRGYRDRLKMFEEAKSGTEKTKTVPTNYAIEARKMDQARAGEYWSQPHEMVARAFAAYVEDKIAENGGQSDFIVYRAHGGILLPMIDGFIARPYPEGKERESINRAFDNFVSTVKIKATDKGVALYSKTGITTASDRKYFDLAEDPEKNQAELQRMVDDAAREAGYTVGPVWHGTRRQFNTFAANKPLSAFGNPEGIYFTDDYREAEEWSMDVDGAKDDRSRVVKAYLKIEEGNGVVREKHGNKEYIVFTPEQVKSADIVVRDDADNIIPLSQRFNPAESDIRHAKISEQTGTTIGQVEAELRTFLGSGYDNLTALGKLRVVQSVAELPRWENLLNMVAYHGSPHQFDKFSMEKIGTGEGVQAYGHGLYFSGAKEVAEYYRKTVPNKTNDELAQYLKAHSSEAYDVIADVVGKQPDMGADDYFVGEMVRKLMTSVTARPMTILGEDYLRVQRAVDSLPSLGQIYEVELAPQEDEYLLWDKPLSEQSETVKTALDKAVSGLENDDKYQGEFLRRGLGPDYVGGAIYRSIVAVYSIHDNDLNGVKMASEFLHRAGIRGIKYLDGDSRAKGEGNYNYVIFNDQDVKITDLYSRSKQKIGGAYDPSTDTMFLVADGIALGSAESVLFHEGFHRAKTRGDFQPIIDELGRLDKRAEKGGGKIEEWFIAARKSAQVEKGAPHYLEEIGAYAVQQYKTAPNVIKRWVEKLVAKVKASLFSFFGIRVGKVDPAMLREIAASGLKSSNETAPIPSAEDSTPAFYRQFGISEQEAKQQYDAVVAKFRSKPLYHVTFTKNVDDIFAKGIMPLQTSNWIKAGSGTRYGNGEIFAFENYEDAARWAARMDWDVNKETGSGKISIVRFGNNDSEEWTEDLSDPMSQAGSKGRWLKCDRMVSANLIIDAAPVTLGITKSLVAGNLEAPSSLWMKAPNGEPTRLNERQWVQTQTPAFKEWFGGSKVVDENGEPLVVHHGTGSDFSSFSPDRIGEIFKDDDRGFFFTTNTTHFNGHEDLVSAGGYAKRAASVTGGAPNIMPSFISAKNPLVFDSKDYLDGFDGRDVVSFLESHSGKKDALRDMDRGGHDAIMVIDRNPDLVHGPEVLVVAFDPNQIKSAIGNTGAFSPHSDDIRYSKEQVIEAAKAIYSKLEQVATVNFLGMKAQGVANFLAKQGVKKAEMEAVGLNEWLAAKKPTDKVTQAELVDFIKANTVELEDVVLGGDKILKWGEWSDPNDDDYGESFIDSSTGERIVKDSQENFTVYDAEGEIIKDGAVDLGKAKEIAAGVEEPTHFSQYTEPGAVEGSYREMFVTAPGSSKTIGWTAKRLNAPDAGFNRWQINDADGNRVTDIVGGSEGAAIRKAAENKGWQDGHSQYSDVKNPIVRIRFNEVNADGKRILRIEEMQGPSKDNQAKMPGYLKENIYSLGVKRILAYAKENNFDGVALATKPGRTAGETQADRYSLENQVDSIKWYAKDDGTYNISFVKNGKAHIAKNGASAQELHGIVGKGLAEKIVVEAENEVAGVIAGLDLSVGGEGLKQLYDNQIPAILEAYGKGKMESLLSGAPFQVERKNQRTDEWETVAEVNSKEEGEKVAAEYQEARVSVGVKAMPYLPITASTPGSYPLYSGVSATTRIFPCSIHTIYDTLTDFWDKETIDSLTSSGVLRIIQNQADLPGGNYKPSAMAWHGSPHQFNRFDLDAIGRGEGNQAFGWGLYFSQEKRVAEWYADHLTEEFKTLSIGDFTEDDLLAVAGGSLFKDAAAQMAKRVDQATTHEQKQRYVDEFKALIKTEIQNAADEIRKIEEDPQRWHNPYLFTTPADQIAALKDEIGRFEKIHNSVTPFNVKRTATKNIYRVALNPGKQHDRWLDWFKEIGPIDRQRIYDQLKAEGLDNNEMARDFETLPKISGVALYYGLSRQLGSKKDASLFLARAGFDGIRYHGEGNRKTGTYNYVVFHDSAVEVQEHTVLHSKSGLRVRGAYYPELQQSYLVAANLTPETAPGVLLHEVGVHAGLRGMLGRTLYGECITQTRRMLEEGDSEMLHAWARIPSVAAGKPASIADAHLSSSRIIEETIGYYVERPENYNTSLAQKIFSGIRTWAFRIGLPVRLKKEDLVSLAKAAVEDVARNPQRLDRAFGVIPQQAAVAHSATDVDTPVFSVEQASPFYSQLENHLVANLPEQTSPAQLRQLLASWSQEGRFSKEELEWSGLVGWINEKEEESTPVLSRESVLGQLAAQRVMVSSVVKDEPTPVPPLLWQSHELATSAEAMDFIPFIHRSSVVLGMWQDLRYGYKVAHTDRGFILLNDQLDEIKSSGAGQNEHGYFTTFEDAQEAATSDLADRIDVVVAWSRRPEYKADAEGYHKMSLSIPHGAENIPFATARFGDRTMEDGRRTLFVRELEGQGAAPLNGADGMLAMKRMILWAAENDYQAIAWPTAAKSSDSSLYREGFSEEVNAYIHQWGSELSSSKLAEQGARPVEVHVFGVTSAMRDAAFAGQPLFSAEETRPEQKEPKGNSMSVKSQDRQEAVQRIKDAVDIVEIIGEHVKLTRAGANYKGLCPFHTEKTPSFTVNPERKTFRCFGCGEGGDAFDFMMRYHGMTFPEAVKELAARYNIPLPEVSHSPEELAKAKQRESLYLANEKAAGLFQGLLDDEQQGQVARQYLAERDIPAEIISRFRIGFAPNRWDFLTTALAKEKISSETGKEAGLLAPRDKGGGFYDRFRNRVVFPILNLTGKVIGFGGRILGEGDPKYLNTPETPIFDKGKNLFGLYQNREAIRQARQALIVEGNFDMVSLVVHGVENVVAPLGTALTSSQIRTLRGYCDEACLIFDGDAAGVKAAMRAVPIFLAEQLPAKVVVLPDGHDPDTFIRAQGKDALLELVSQAKPLSEFLFDELVRQHGATIEGKSRIVSELRTIIDGLDDRDLQRTLFGVHFAEKLGIPPEQLLASLGGSKKPAAEAEEIPQAVARMAGQGESIAWPDLSRFGVRLGYSGSDRRSACLALQVMDLEKMMTSVSDHSHIIFQEGLGIDPLRLSAAERGDVFLSSAKSASARLLKDLFPDFNLASDIKPTLKSALFLPLDYWRQAPLTEYINEVYRLAAETGGDPLLSPDSFSQVLAAREGGVSPAQCAALYFTTGKGVVAPLGETPIAAASEILPMETPEPVTKEKVFPPLKSAGVEPAAAMVIKILRERLPVDSAKNMVTIDAKSGAQAHSSRVYTMVLGNIHDELKKVKTTEDLRGAMERLRSKIRPAFGTASKNSSPEEILFAQQFLESVGQKALGIVRDYEIILSWAEDRAKSQAEPKPAVNKVAKKPAAATPGRPVPKKIIRHGSDVRSGEAITPQRLMDDFGFTAVKFDSLMKGPERQALLNHAYEAFSDLAETTGLDRLAMSLQGSHSLLFSGKASHYAIHEAVLHLPIATKGGGLAHQWAHAFQAVVAQSGKSSVFSGVNEAMTRTIIKAGERRVVLEQDVKRLGEWSQALINYFGKRLPEDNKGVFLQKARLQLVAVAKLETTPQLAMNEISRLYSEFSPRAFNKKESDRLFGNIFWLHKASTERRTVSALRPDLGYEHKDTQYFYNAKLLDKSRKQDLWASQPELFARAFEAFVSDRMREQQWRSDYLVYGVEAERFADSAILGSNPYPTGTEREAINQAIAGAVIAASHLCFRQQSTHSSANNMEKQSEEMSDAPKVRAAGV